MSVNHLSGTPNALRLQIALFGKRNSGKSSLINALTGRALAIVSDTPGTTTDPVQKAIEIYPLGPCVLIDTAGLDDLGALGALRVKKTEEVLERCDVGILVVEAGAADTTEEMAWLARLTARNTPVVVAVNKSDRATEIPAFAQKLPHALVSALTGAGIDTLRERLVEIAPVDCEPQSITGHLVKAGDRVLLVAPQEINAPKGRLILPQVQTLRDLLDLGAMATIVTLQNLASALAAMKEPPNLIITDSQVFPQVKALCPPGVPLTSFSILMARYKGDIAVFLEGAKAIDTLTESSRVLILEACAHNPLDGDIGRVKIPAALRKRVGQGLSIQVAAGNDIPEDLSPFSLIIHCGACMFTRKHVLSRITRAKAAGCPITNYGVALAHLAGIPVA